MTYEEAESKNSHEYNAIYERFRKQWITGPDKTDIVELAQASADRDRLKWTRVLNSFREDANELVETIAPRKRLPESTLVELRSQIQQINTLADVYTLLDRINQLLV